jgi:homocitrate synthase NifV
LWEEEDDDEEYHTIPDLIDVTVPVHFERAPGEVSKYSQEWRTLMAGIGVTKVKMPGSRVYSTDSLVGMDRAMLGDFASIFHNLRELELPEVVFGNRHGLATALAAAWLEGGGRGVVASLGGAGGLPALEELRMMLHTSGRLPLREGRGDFKRLRQIGEALSGERTPSNKPVTGFAIFAVESGIHVDGLLKDPGLYEPYPPDLVGGRRFLSVGLHSGRNSIRLKCERLGLFCDQGLLESLNEEIHRSALALERGLTEGEFRDLHARLVLERKAAEGEGALQREDNALQGEPGPLQGGRVFAGKA